jgi:A/G-specific adenine glycosylase
VQESMQEEKSDGGAARKLPGPASVPAQEPRPDSGRSGDTHCHAPMPISLQEDDILHLRLRLLDWFDEDARPMLWREDRHPYRVLVSEVMLQQTRVDQAAPYFERFMHAFPRVEDLANAPVDKVLRLWEGLGYYSRARNLHRSAQVIVQDYGGTVPAERASLRALPGVGDYTSAAVLSIAFGQAHAVVDGNVKRVLARLVGIQTPVDTSAGTRAIGEIATALLDRNAPGRFNEAVMDLGATVCLPRNPRCGTCPWQVACAANATGRQHELPVKKPAKKVPHYDIAVGIVVGTGGRLLIQRRPEEAMLGGLWEFPGGKREEGEGLEETCARELMEELGVGVSVGEHLMTLKHAYSHFKITLHAFRCTLAGTLPENGRPDRQWVAIEELGQFAFPRANRRLVEFLTRSAVSQAVEK